VRCGNIAKNGFAVPAIAESQSGTLVGMTSQFNSEFPVDRIDQFGTQIFHSVTGSEQTKMEKQKEEPANTGLR